MIDVGLKSPLVEAQVWEVVAEFDAEFTPVQVCLALGFDQSRERDVLEVLNAFEKRGCLEKFTHNHWPPTFIKKTQTDAISPMGVQTVIYRAMRLQKSFDCQSLVAVTGASKAAVKRYLTALVRADVVVKSGNHFTLPETSGRYAPQIVVIEAVYVPESDDFEGLCLRDPMASCRLRSAAR